MIKLKSISYVADTFEKLVKYLKKEKLSHKN